MEGPQYEALLDELMIRNMDVDALMVYLENGELDMMAQDVVIQRIKDLKEDIFDYVKYHEHQFQGLKLLELTSGTHNWLYYDAMLGDKKIKVRISTQDLKELEVLHDNSNT